MEIVIHGTKGGYKNNFIPYATSSFAVGDIRRGSADENPVGQSAYSIAFDNKGYIVTKYIIIRDTLRSYAVGFIGFSLFLPADKELTGKGASIQSLLDEVSDLYKEHYIKSNNINCDKTTLIQEDWSFISQITAKYQEQTNPNEEQIDSISRTNAGTEFPAFIYYSSDKELQKYFDTPFQEEYKKYQQVLFIKAELKDKKENPLHVLRNSDIDLTGKIDLDHLNYKIINYSKFLESINNTSPTKLNNHRIHYNDTLKFVWSKPYYYNIEKEISISEADNISIVVDHSRHTISINDPIDWEPKTKIIHIEVVDYNKNPIENAQISVNKGELNIDKKELLLKGEELKDIITIEVIKEELKGHSSITPYNHNSIQIELHKTKEIGDQYHYNIKSNEDKESFIKNKYIKKVLLTFSIMVIISILGFFYLFTMNHNCYINNISSQITTYTKGDSLIMSKLNELDKLDNLEMELEVHFTFIFTYLPCLKSNKTDSIYQQAKMQLKRASDIRTAIDKKEFESLKDSTFSEKQRSFKNAIDTIIKSDYYQPVIDKLGEISNMPISEIADSIDSIYRSIKVSVEKKSKSIPTDSISKCNKTRGISSNKNISSKSLSTSQDQFITCLKSDNITKDQLNKTKNESHKESIKLYLEFWDLVSANKGKDEFTDFLNNKIKKDSILEKSKLRDFLEFICKNSNNFDNNFAHKPGRDTFKNCESLSKLKEKLNIK